MAEPRPESPLDLLPRWPLVVVIVLVVVGAGLVPVRSYIGKRAARALIVPAPADTTTPQSLGVPYAALTLRSGDHAIRAWWVRAPSLDSGGAAVLLFNANRSTLSRQAGIQQVLYRAGVSSLAFDYSGFGASDGEASPEALRQDALAAVAAFGDSARPAGRRVLLGTSLGAAVLLDVIAEAQPGVDGVVLVSPFLSARDLAVRTGRVPGALSFMVPHVYHNLAAVRRLTKPLLVVHSEQDTVFPIEIAERLLDAGPGAKRLERLDRGAHDEYLSSDAHWVPVIRFIKQGLDVTS